MEPIDLLIVEDDPDLLDMIEEAFAGDPYRAVAATSFERAWRLIDERKDASVDVAILDLYVGKKSAIDVIPTIRERFPTAEVVVMTGQADVETAVAAMKAGARDYLVKPVPLSGLRQAVERAHEGARLRRENQALRHHVSRGEAVGMVAASPKSSAMLTLIDKLGPADLPVLILGETGAGKELVARRLHGDRTSSFIAVNGAALTRELALSELFGHERGAFTGAIDRRLGLVELADGGTLFLDEVGDLSSSVQVSLLRFLESGEFRRVGGQATLEARVRIVTATNRDLGADVAAGRFRQDLLFRLTGATIEVPPLRERPDDLAAAVRQFLAELGQPDKEVEPAALDLLKQHRWPGNFRELRNVVCRAAAFAPDGPIGVDDLPDDVRGGGGGAHSDIAELTFREMEGHYLRRVLERHEGNKTRAAKAMKIDVRTLYSKIKKLGLDL